MNLEDPVKGLSHMSDSTLKKSVRIFQLMGSWLSSLITCFLSWTQIPLKFGFVKTIIRRTIYKQFVGGENLQELQSVIGQLASHDVKTIIDFAKEADRETIDIKKVSTNILEILEFASTQKEVFGICLKITAFLSQSLLEKMSAGLNLTPLEKETITKIKAALMEIGEKAEQAGVPLFIDAEESWIQGAIDDLAIMMMRRFNRSTCIVYNTYQMYRKDRLEFLKNNLIEAQFNNYILGAKVVRGAYMDKEGKRAKAMSYPNPIHDTKAFTDKAYNDAITLLSQDKLAHVCIATHNVESCEFALSIMKANNQRFSFSQLYGMSDALSHNIAHMNKCVTKYLPFGNIEMVIPYLIRRVQENKSMDQEMGRELAVLSAELKRRKKLI